MLFCYLFSYLFNNSGGKKFLHQGYNKAITKNLKIKDKTAVTNNQVEETGLLNAYSS